MITIRKVTFALAAICAFAAIAADVPPAPPVEAPNPLVWDALTKEATLAGMTNIVYFTFGVTNTAATEVTILSTESSCDCTVVESKEKLPWHLAPGEAGVLNVHVNTLGRYGMVEKSITVKTSAGTQTLAIRLNIPISAAPSNVSVRNQDRMAAQADRQAVFHGSCAACHAWPAVGKSGEKLFELACAICHISEHRAEMVPDLANLNHEMTGASWQAMITNGKTNSLMPAFGIPQGGILETNQIDSLVEYLMKRYPAKPLAPSTP